MHVREGASQYVDVRSVLLVSHDAVLGEALTHAFAGAEFVVRRTDNPAEVDPLAAAGAVELVLVDVRMHSVQWLQSLVETRASLVPVVALVPEGELVAVERWLSAGYDHWTMSPSFVGLRHLAVKAARTRALVAQQTASDDSLRAGTAALLRFARSAHFVRGENIAQALTSLTEIAVSAMRVERATVWRFDDAMKTLTMVDGFDVRTGAHEAGRTLLMAEHPEYLAALKTQSIVSAGYARSDPRTKSFAEGLFNQSGIESTLDVVIRQRGEPVGVLCFEKAGAPARWSATQEVFGGALADVLSLTLETAERFRAEEALQLAERRFREVFEHSNDILVTYRVAMDGAVFLEDINPAGERATGMQRADLVGRNADQVLSRESAERLNARFAQCIQQRAPVSYEHELVIGTRKVVFHTSLVPLIDEHGRVHRLAAIARDMSAKQQAEHIQRQLEAQLAEAQKNDALARLAAHVAHDFNNLLTVVSAHASRLEGQVGLAKEVGQRILQASARGQELTQQILTFGRRKPPAASTFDWTKEVANTLALLAATAPHITFQELLTPQARVTADKAQLNQVLTNLVSNAIESMGEKGDLEVALTPMDVDEQLAKLNPPLSPGRWVKLTVKDSGVGMDSVTRRRIFEPYFTNRGSGGGTGLGLTVVQGIVLSLGGGHQRFERTGSGHYIFGVCARGPRGARWCASSR